MSKDIVKNDKILSRRKARDYAYQLIFSFLFNGEKDELLLQRISEDKHILDEDLEYINSTYDMSIDNIEDIKATIEKYAIGYQLDRIYKPDLAVLILAICEMKYNTEIPRAVAISEAVSIIKKYSTAKSGPFVNGILSSVYKELTNETN